MRNLFLIALILNSVLLFSQSVTNEYSFTSDTGLVEEVFYCGIKLDIPDGGIAGEAKIKKDSQFIQWMNLEKIPEVLRDEVAISLQDELVKNLLENLKKAKSKSLRFSSLGQELRGKLISGEMKGKKSYFFLAHGDVKECTVVINCRMDNKPKSNKDIPDFIRQIIEFKE